MSAWCWFQNGDLWQNLSPRPRHPHPYRSLCNCFSISRKEFSGYFGFLIFSHWKRQLHCEGSTELALKGRDEGDPLIHAKVSFGQALLLASLGLSRTIKFTRIRDQPHLFLSVPIPWSPCNELILFCGKKIRHQKIPLDMSKGRPPLDIRNVTCQWSFQRGSGQFSTLQKPPVFVDVNCVSKTTITM